MKMMAEPKRRIRIISPDGRKFREHIANHVWRDQRGYEVSKDSVEALMQQGWKVDNK